MACGAYKGTSFLPFDKRILLCKYCGVMQKSCIRPASGLKTRGRGLVCKGRGGWRREGAGEWAKRRDGAENGARRARIGCRGSFESARGLAQSKTLSRRADGLEFTAYSRLFSLILAYSRL